MAAAEIEKQISELLSQITIGEEFQQWALKYLHEVRTNEAQTDQQILKNKQASYENVVKQLHKLMLTYTSADNAENQLMTAAELTELKADLLQEKARLESELQAYGEHINDWIELTEKTFNFARYAQIWFNKGDLQTKKAVLACIGSNFLLKDQKLQVTLKKPFEVIAQNITYLRSSLTTARTSSKTHKDLANKEKTPAQNADVVSWLGIV